MFQASFRRYGCESMNGAVLEIVRSSNIKKAKRVRINLIKQKRSQVKPWPSAFIQPVLIRSANVRPNASSLAFSFRIVGLF